MSEYTPACSIYTDEDFEFTWTVDEIDEETWDISYRITENPRCETCFLREQCIDAIVALLQKEYNLPRESFEIEWGPKIVCN